MMRTSVSHFLLIISTFNLMYSTVSTCNTKLLLCSAAPTISKEKYMARDGKLQVWLLKLR